ncbi:MAG: DUF362 domain-containing protein [Candidatus Zixiibacteriota bacterium]|nr:MAG: DUF362 domain-containing protein [candidate division Zixibacteria bacterium]
MKRREFLKKTGQAAALAAMAGDVVLINNGCQSGGKGKAIVTKADFEVAADPQFPKVALARNEDHARALGSALDAIGGISRFVKKGEKVLLKPNVAFDRVPEQAVNTNPVLVGEMVRQCRIAGASEILVTDNGPNNPVKTFSRCGLKQAVEQSGGKVLYLNASDFIEDNLKGKFITSWLVLRYTFEVDRLINMPIAKHHGLVYGTASMKNFFGAIGGIRDGLHDQIDQAIVDLAAYFRPTLTVVDATRVLMRAGPQGGSFDDVEIFDSVICSTDQVAADSRACEFLGLTGEGIKHVVLAAEQGLGQIDYRKAGYKEII